MKQNAVLGFAPGAVELFKQGWPSPYRSRSQMAAVYRLLKLADHASLDASSGYASTTASSTSSARVTAEVVAVEQYRDYTASVLP